MTDSLPSEAARLFNSGFNCSQSILAAFCEKFGMDRETALKLACGFGGGMGRLQETCGAVTGAFMLLGLKYGGCTEDGGAAKEKTYSEVREFAARFAERNGSIKCRELVGVDFLYGDKKTVSVRVKEICPHMVESAAEILKAMLEF